MSVKPAVLNHWRLRGEAPSAPTVSLEAARQAMPPNFMQAHAAGRCRSASWPDLFNIQTKVIAKAAPNVEAGTLQHA
jgi:hypothetical protein